MHLVHYVTFKKLTCIEIGNFPYHDFFKHTAVSSGLSCITIDGNFVYKYNLCSNFAVLNWHVNVHEQFNNSRLVGNRERFYPIDCKVNRVRCEQKIIVKWIERPPLKHHVVTIVIANKRLHSFVLIPFPDIHYYLWYEKNGHLHTKLDITKHFAKTNYVWKIRNANKVRNYNLNILALHFGLTFWQVCDNKHLIS